MHDQRVCSHCECTEAQRVISRRRITTIGPLVLICDPCYEATQIQLRSRQC